MSKKCWNIQIPQIQINCGLTGFPPLFVMTSLICFDFILITFHQVFFFFLQKIYKVLIIELHKCCNYRNLSRMQQWELASLPFIIRTAAKCILCRAEDDASSWRLLQDKKRLKTTLLTSHCNNFRAKIDYFKYCPFKNPIPEGFEVHLGQPRFT